MNYHDPDRPRVGSLPALVAPWPPNHVIPIWSVEPDLDNPNYLTITVHVLTGKGSFTQKIIRHPAHDFHNLYARWISSPEETLAYSFNATPPAEAKSAPRPDIRAFLDTL